MYTDITAPGSVVTMNSWYCHHYLINDLFLFSLGNNETTIDIKVDHFPYILDEFRKDYNTHIKSAVEQQGMLMGKESHLINDSGAASEVVKCDGGRKITFDNFDYHQDVHYMTEEHQNVDKHFVILMATENRMSGSELSDTIPDRVILPAWTMQCAFQMQLIINGKGLITSTLLSVFL